MQVVHLVKNFQFGQKDGVVLRNDTDKDRGPELYWSCIVGLESQLKETAKDLNILFIIHDLNSDKSIQPSMWEFP